MASGPQDWRISTVLSPSRRQQLREGARAFTEFERRFQQIYRAHQEERRAAAERRR